MFKTITSMIQVFQKAFPGLPFSFPYNKHALTLLTYRATGKWQYDKKWTRCI